MRTGAALLLLSALVNAANANAGGAASSAPPAAVKATSPARVEVAGPRVRASDVVAGAPELDLGPTPPIGASRLVERGEIERAFAAAGLPAPRALPAAVRVTRKTRRLAANEVTAAVKTAIDAQRLPRGAVVTAVRAPAFEVPGDFQRVAVELAPIPRRAGTATVSATVTFLGEGDAPIQRAIVPIDVALPPEAAFPEIARGASLTLTVRRGLVEVSVPAVAAADADVGAVVPVTLKPSGRVVRARAVDRDHAVALEDS